MISIKICELVLQMAKDKPHRNSRERVTHINCCQIAEEVFSFIQDKINNINTNLEISTSLEFDFDGEIDIYKSPYDEVIYDSCDTDTITQNSESLSQQISQDWEEETMDGVNFSYQEMVNIEFYNKAKKNKFHQTKLRYSKIRHYNTILRLKN